MSSLPPGAASERPTPLDSGNTLTEDAYRALRRDILRGVRQPGERLRIERLRGLYGIGPTPLREALQKLGAEQLVTVEGNRGFTVAPLDFADFDDLNTARSAVESAALRLSLTHGRDAWEAGVVAAAYLLRKEDRALHASSAGVPDAWEAANRAFHAATVAACGSTWLLRVREGLHDQSERYRRASVYQRQGSRDLAREHAEIAEAVLAREIARACRLVDDHFALTATSLSRATPTDRKPREPPADRASPANLHDPH